MIHPEDKNRKTLLHMVDYLNNPQTAEYPPNQIWTDNFIEKRPWPFQKGTGREGPTFLNTPNADRSLRCIVGRDP